MEEQAVVHYLNRLYNMQPDAELLQRMVEVSEARGIAPSEWQRGLIPRFCRG